MDGRATRRTLAVLLAAGLAVGGVGFSAWAKPSKEKEDRRSERGAERSGKGGSTNESTQKESSATGGGVGSGTDSSTETQERHRTQSLDQEVEKQQEGGTGRNPGHVKIDGIPFASFPPSNQPHVGCVLQIQFFGFDAEKTASWTLTLHEPTEGGVLASGEVTFTQDAQGNELNEAVTVDLTQALADSGVEPHPQQGFHVRLDVETPDGPKHKVFWVQCLVENGVSAEDVGRVTIIKDAPEATTETFTFGGAFGTFELEHLESVTFPDLEPDTYVVVEQTPPEGWQLEDIECELALGGTAPVTINLGARQVMIELDTEQHVICTFFNAAVLDLIVEQPNGVEDEVLGEVIVRDVFEPDVVEAAVAERPLALAVTGGDTWLLVALALFLMTAGGGLVWAGRIVGEGT